MTPERKHAILTRICARMPEHIRHVLSESPDQVIQEVTEFYTNRRPGKAERDARYRAMGFSPETIRTSREIAEVYDGLGGQTAKTKEELLHVLATTPLQDRKGGRKRRRSRKVEFRRAYFFADE